MCAANDIAKTKNKGQAWLYRNIYVPFTGQFIGASDDKTICSQWVVSESVCEYMAYHQTLVKWKPYYELPEPKEAIESKEEWMRDNDPVVDFYETVVRNCNTDFVPRIYAWDMYVHWLRETRPSTPYPFQKAFVAHLIEITTSGDK